MIRRNPYLAWISILLMADYRPYAVLHRPAHPEALQEVLRLAVILRPAQN